MEAFPFYLISIYILNILFCIWVYCFVIMKILLELNYIIALASVQSLLFPCLTFGDLALSRRRVEKNSSSTRVFWPACLGSVVGPCHSTFSYSYWVIISFDSLAKRAPPQFVIFAQVVLLSIMTGGTDRVRQWGKTIAIDASQTLPLLQRWSWS